MSTLSSSVGNVMLVIAASQLSGDLASFAGFGVAQSMLILVFGTSRAAFGEVLIVESVGRRQTEPGLRGLSAVPATVLAAGAAGVVGLMLLPVFPSEVRPYLTVAALGAPIILAQDTVRYVLFTNDRHRRAAALDVAWAVLTAVAAVLAWALDRGPLAIMVMWTVAGLIVTLAADRSIPPALFRFASGSRWITSHRSDSSRLAIEAFAATAVVGLPPALASLFAVSDVAVVARVLFSAFGIQQMVYAISLISVGLSAADPWRTARRVGLVGTATAIITTLTIRLIPSGLGSMFFAEGFAPSRDVVFWFGAGQVGAAVASGAIVGLRMSGVIHRTAVVRTICTTGATLVATIGAAVDGTVGYAVGLSFGFGFYGLAMMALLWLTTRDSPVSSNLRSEIGTG